MSETGRPGEVSASEQGRTRERRAGTLWLGDGRELIAPTHGPARASHGRRMRGGFAAVDARRGSAAHTDGLTEARRDGKQFGLDGVSAARSVAFASRTDRGGRHPAPNRR
jgi:hypothetical protein